jgi:mRNA interferase MazF
VVIQQGDVVWVDLPAPDDSSPGGRHPAVVLQHDRFNRTALNTIVVVMLTSQLRYEAQPGNVRLRKGEAGLPKASVVNVTQIATLDRASLAAKIGRLSRDRLAEIWKGVCLVLAPG